MISATDDENNTSSSNSAVLGQWMKFFAVREKPQGRYLLKTIFLTMAYFVLARFGMQFGTAFGSISPVWPAAGLALSTLIIDGIALWPGVFIGTWAAIALGGVPIGFCLAASVANTLGAVVAAYIFRHLGGDRHFVDLRSAKVFLQASIIGAFVAAIVGAWGATAMLVSGDIPMWKELLVWFMGDLYGDILFGTTLLVIRWNNMEAPFTVWVRREVPPVSVIGLLVLLVVSIFTHYAPIPVPMSFLPLTVAIFPIMSGGLITSCIAGLIVTTAATTAVRAKMGPFADHLVTEPVWLAMLQVHNVFVGAGSFLLGVLVNQMRAGERESKRLNEKLAESNRELEQFAAVAAHDLKSPLNSMYSWASLLDLKVPQPRDESVDHAINFIKLNAMKGTNLIGEVLDVARLHSAVNCNQQIDLNQVLKSVLRVLSEEIRTSGAEIEMGLLPIVTGNALHIEMLFSNLIRNAIKYRDKSRHPKVEIGYRAMTESFEFFVKDNGIGISAENTKHVFEMFRRLHPDSEFSGTGIGLAYCKKVVELHGGKIWVESRQGEGSVFYFTLPRRRNHQA